MCRMLGVVAAARAPLSTLIADDLDPYLGLACEHNNGWGIATVSETHTVTTAKEHERADLSPEFARVVRKTVTDAAVLHLRLASPHIPVTHGNTHLFGDERIAFAHYGGFRPPTCLDSFLGPEALATTQGDTDSERFYLAVRRRIDDGMRPEKAIAATAADIHAVADQYASLNCLLLTPDAL
ncbi:hypothetical protein RVR_2489 [Actinacidiphila reveromycinica]|uniref:Glutamine amidotransferase type-2 domain-containing protein n=1 Tax=Actinacidiphila reveromycinica TaxID=659352 RepID=A0A7U3UQN5_9ACTN|nr:class II glutamine amidotransferase [Streptomyces sp. SN-593]BBA96955.1 hypothetical protein RVR_2489 [Streptomyces sp. SN-593]